MTNPFQYFQHHPGDVESDIVVVFDWYDGPRSGVCRFKTPHADALFELLAERPTEDGLDDRLYVVTLLPTGTVARIVATLACFGAPSGRVWIPRWDTSNPAASSASSDVDTLLQITKLTRPEIVLLSSDMEVFRGCWIVDELANRTDVDDWFTHLGITDTT